MVFAYFLFVGFMVMAVAFLTTRDNAVLFSQGPMISFSEGWTFETESGDTGTIDLPGSFPDTGSRYVTLRKTLPSRLEENTYFVYRTSHSFPRVSIGGQVLLDRITEAEQNDQWYSWEGNNYWDIRLLPEYAGQEIVVEMFSPEPKHVSQAGRVYLGERGNLLLDILKSRMGTFVFFVVLFMSGIMILTIWAGVMFVAHHNLGELLCLAFFTLSVSVWLFTETQMAQLLSHGNKALILLAYEDLMLIPVPIAMFFYYASERELCRRLSKYAAIPPLFIFVINNLLHMLKIASLAATLPFTQVMLGLEVCFVGFIQIAELRYINQHNQTGERIGKIPVLGIIVLVPCAMIEIGGYLFSEDQYGNDGTLIAAGVTVYIMSLALDSLIRTSYRSAKLRESSQIKTQFLANMSHEIRTPLNAMMGFNDAILQNPGDVKKINEYSQKIHDSGESLKAIINSILDISKIEMGQLRIENDEYNALELLDGLSSMFELLARKKDLRFTTVIDPEIPTRMVGDEQHLRQVLVNLLSNAVKYTDEGSVIFSVKVVRSDKGAGTISLHFSVKDTGRGIREEDVETLFAKFGRLDTEHFKHTEGSGLGMSIVRFTLEAMKSEIRLDSVYGRGSDFFFDLEQKLVAEAEPIGDFEERRKDLSIKDLKTDDFRAPRASVLIADDVDMNIDAVCALLEFTGMKMDKALSGQQAIDMISEKKYDAVFMDHMMPGMDGIQATEKIRALALSTGDSYYARVPVIALTANAMAGMREVYQLAGMQDFVSKPVELETIITALKKWLPKELIEKDSSGQAPQVTRVAPVASQPKEQVQTIPADNSQNSVNSATLDIDGIDVAEALKYNVDMAGLVNNLKKYAKACENNRAEIEGYFNSMDLTNYVVKVHGLKSTSKMVGAMELFELAAMIEARGNKGDASPTDFDTLMFMYEVQCQRISEFFEAQEKNMLQETGVTDTKETDRISPEEYEELIERIKAAADGFNAIEFMVLEEELEDIAVPEEFEEEMKTLYQMIVGLAFGPASEFLASRKDKVF